MMKILEGKLKAQRKRFAIVVSRFNDFVTKRLLDGCQKELLRLGIKENQIMVIGVPGAYEIPLAALKAARRKDIDAVICLGAVIRGETVHFDLVAHGAARGIAQVALTTGKPVIFGVLATDTVDQAYKRAGKSENRGRQAGRDAVQMADLMDRLSHA